MRLKTDVLTSTNDGLLSEKTHLTVELKETRGLAKSYEAKTNQLMESLSSTTTEFQALKRNMISHDEMTRVREERIAKFKGDLEETAGKLEGLELAHGTLQIQHAKVTEQRDTAVKDLKDTNDKLHITNKVRHETEVKLAEELENSKQLKEVLKLNNETLSRKTAEQDDLDKRLIDLQRTHEALDTKKQGIERQFELSKKQLNEKIGNLNDIIDGEKTTRDMWIERYEKEQREHSTTNAQYLQCKSEHRDQMLATKNAEIKLQTVQRQVDILTAQNEKFQTTINETMSKSEVLERDLNVQNEKYKQYQISKQQYIDKLKKELNTVESRYTRILNDNAMVGEDFRSQAFLNMHKYLQLRIYTDEADARILVLEKDLKFFKDKSEKLE